MGVAGIPGSDLIIPMVDSNEPFPLTHASEDFNETTIPQNTLVVGV